MLEERGELDASVTQQAVHLLDGVLALGAAGDGHGTADAGYGQATSLDDAVRGDRQGLHALGVHVAVERRVDEVVDLPGADVSAHEHGFDPLPGDTQASSLRGKRHATMRGSVRTRSRDRILSTFNTVGSKSAVDFSAMMKREHV